MQKQCITNDNKYIQIHTESGKNSNANASYLQRKWKLRRNWNSHASTKSIAGGSYMENLKRIYFWWKWSGHTGRNLAIFTKSLLPQPHTGTANRPQWEIPSTWGFVDFESPRSHLTGCTLPLMLIRWSEFWGNFVISRKKISLANNVQS